MTNEALKRRRLRVLNEVEHLVSECTSCQELCTHRTHTVFARGDHTSRIMVIGEAPGAEEDAQGKPFVGRSGKLLDHALAKAGLTDAVYITNIIKCRPPGNRPPTSREVERCLPYLRSQVSEIVPRVIVTLGKSAASALLGKDDPMSSMRGQRFSWQGRLVIPSWHPSYILRGNKAALAELISDLKLAGKLAPRR